MKKFYNAILLSGIALLASHAMLQAQTIVPTQTDEIIIDNGTSGKADPGDRIRYKVTIQNSGGPSGSNTQLNVVPDPRTTFVAGTFKSSPLAVPDAYTCTGNVGINVPAGSGVKVNDFDDNLSGATLSVTTPPTNGSVTLNNDGSFSYAPNAGFTGTDVFTYTMTDVTPVPTAPVTDAASVTITVSNVIWFVDNTGGGSGGTGTLTTPFKTLTNFNASAGPQPGHIVFIKNTGTKYNGGIVLKNNMSLFGSGHTGGANLADVLPFALAPNSNALPAINGTRPIIVSPTNGITLASNNTIRGVDVGYCPSAPKIFGTNFGTLTIGNTTNPDVALSGNQTTLSLTNGTFAATSKLISINSLDSSKIVLNTVSGSLACGSTLVNSQGLGGNITIDIQNSSAALDFGSTTATNFNGGTVISILSSPSGSVTFSNLSIPNTVNGVGLTANNGGTINIGGTSSAITAKTALNITNTSFGAGATFASITATNFFGTPGVNLNNVSGGALLINGGSITATFSIGNAFNVNGGSSDITYAGTISYTGTSTDRPVQVTARTGGTVTLSGNITASAGLGINVANNTGGTVVFSGSSKNLNMGSSTAVTLTNNTGATINFSGGGLVLIGATGFNATGGGTVTVTGTGNTISSTTGTALNVVNTTIGASNLNFQSISHNGGGNGIVLNNTGSSGGLVVTGTGVANSGGTIQNTSGDAINLLNANSISLTDMVISTAGGSWIDANTVTGLTLVRLNADLSTDHGILGNTVRNLTITGGTYDRGGAGSVACNINGLFFTNLLGTNTVTGATFRRSNTIQFRVNNTTATNFGGAPDVLTVSGTTWNTHNNACAGDHLSVNSDTGGNFRLVVNSSSGINTVNEGGTFSTGGGIGVQATCGGTNGKMDVSITGLKTTNNTAGVGLGNTGGGSLTYNVFGNKTSNGTGFSSTGSLAIAFVQTGSGTTSGIIDDNSITHTAGTGTDAFQMVLEGNGTATARVSNNNISGNFQRGMNFRSGLGTGTFNLTLDNNTLNGTGSGGLQAINIQTGVSGMGSGNSICLNMLNNDVTFGVGASYAAAYRLTNGITSMACSLPGGCNFQLQNFSGNGSVVADVQSWVTTTKANTTGGGAVSVTINSNAFGSSAGCPAP